MLGVTTWAYVALVSAYAADALGNLTYRKTARNFGPIMASAATTTIVRVREMRAVGGIDPEHVVTHARHWPKPTAPTSSTPARSRSRSCPDRRTSTTLIVRHDAPRPP